MLLFDWELTPINKFDKRTRFKTKTYLYLHGSFDISKLLWTKLVRLTLETGTKSKKDKLSCFVLISVLWQLFISYTLKNMGLEMSINAISHGTFGIKSC